MTYDSDTNTSYLEENSDFGVDSGIFFVHTYRKITQEEEPPIRIVNDWKILEGWLDCSERKISKHDEEKIGKAWKAYLAIGLAPSFKLQGVFDTLSKQYKDAGYSFKVDKAPTKVMDVFDRMLATKEDVEKKRKHDEARALKREANKWRPRPFHQNKSKVDEAEWFANAPKWSRVDSRLISTLIERLHDSPMFEVFVHASQDCDIVEKYIPLSALFEKGVGDVAALPRVAETLCTAGVDQGEKCVSLMNLKTVDNQEAGRLYYNAMNACEAAIHVEPNYLVAYLRLAELKRLLRKEDDAINFCEKGLAQIKRLSTVPFPSRSGMELRQSIEETKVALESMLKELKVKSGSTMRDYCPACEIEVEYDKSGYCSICGRTKSAAEKTARGRVEQAREEIIKRVWIALVVAGVVAIIYFGRDG
ncbi:hypothetical protein JYU13_00920 [Gammaproteobacteria bacterium AH-315-M22]|nr:hypothetical protein [Gammaproteobacteria bacterium AH-315-M22]